MRRSSLAALIVAFAVLATALCSGCGSGAGGAAPATHTVVGPTPHAPAAAGDAAVRLRFADVTRLPDRFGVIDRGRNGGGPTIAAGAFTHGRPRAADAATYLTTDVAGPVRRIGAAARFTGGANNGVIALLVTGAPVPADGSAPAPSAAVHFVADAQGWSYGVWRAGDDAQDVLASGRYRTPITLGAASFEVRLDGDRATVILPDGTAVTVTDPRIADNGGPVATWELYESSPVARPAAFTAVWAS